MDVLISSRARVDLILSMAGEDDVFKENVARVVAPAGFFGLVWRFKVGENFVKLRSFEGGGKGKERNGPIVSMAKAAFGSALEPSIL